MNFLRRLFGLEEKSKVDPQMKYLVVGLGNMGAEYDRTRHNVGFEVVDTLAKNKEISFKQEMLGDLAELRHKGRTFFLLKPSTYMNLSGKSVRHWMTKKKVSMRNVLIILDDLNLPFGKIRLRAKGKDGGHNGLKDIDRMLGSNQYARLRIGIGKQFDKGRQVDYVLGKWDADESAALPDIIKTACEQALDFGSIGIQHAMSKHNT